jgi:hypothetical protein
MKAVLDPKRILAEWYQFS